MSQAQFFRNRPDTEKALAAIEAALKTSYPDKELAPLMKALRRRPLLRAIVLRMVREEVVGANLAQATTQIDWDAIADFLIKIAPLIIDLIERFM